MKLTDTNQGSPAFKHQEGPGQTISVLMRVHSKASLSVWGPSNTSLSRPTTRLGVTGSLSPWWRVYTRCHWTVELNPSTPPSFLADGLSTRAEERVSGLGRHNYFERETSLYENPDSATSRLKPIRSGLKWEGQVEFLPPHGESQRGRTCPMLIHFEVPARSKSSQKWKESVLLASVPWFQSMAY